VLFGDGAGAVVLSATDGPGILSSHLHADGSFNGILGVPARIDQGRVSGSPFVHMDGNAVYRFAVRVLAEAAHEALDANGFAAADVDWLVPHQANIRIIESTAKKLGLPMERVVVTVDRHANTSAASIPLALDHAVRSGQVKVGQTVMLEGVGGGFTWGAVLAKM
jgi:3-oxoacyl-[acyl-carrier-protein] synthase-3